MAKQKRRIYCKFCDFFCYDTDDFVSHLERHHEEMIPEDMTPWQFFYYLKTGKTHGTCIVCKGNTSWNEKTHKYNRFCDKKQCKDTYREMFKNRMIGKYGRTTLLNDPEQQKKMLANRKISGEYIWRDHVHKTLYTGSYEKSFLEFLDEVMNFDPNDVMAPSPHTYWYEYDGKKHFYIPDFFIPSLNLEIEIKDGGDNMNHHPKIQAVDKVKESLKDDVMKKNEFNYIKIVNKENEKFLEYLENAKNNAFEKKSKPIFMIEKELTLDDLNDKCMEIMESVHEDETYEESTNTNKLYHLAFKENIKELKPSIPNNYMTKHGFEDDKTPRVCFTPSIDQCLMSLSQKCQDMELYVYIPDGNYKPYKATLKDVPDCKITDETWITEPVKVKCIGKIKVIDDKGEKGLPYKYGDKTAELYAWNWKWIDKAVSESALDDSMIDTVVFDLGSVLVEWSARKAEENSTLPSEYFEELEKEYFDMCFDPSTEQMTVPELIQCFKDRLRDDLKEYAEKAINIFVCSTEILDYTVDMIKSLKEKGYKIYYLSNWGKASFALNKEKGAFKFLKYFDGGIVSYQVKMMKPEKGIYEALIKKYNLDPGKCLFYDDKQENIDAANKLGFNGRLFSYKNNTQQKIFDLPDLSNSNAVTESVDESAIKQIKDFNKELAQYEYILVTSDGIVENIKREDYKKYKILNPAEFKKNHGGICWDYCVYEEKQFTFSKHKFFFFCTVDKDGNPVSTHTFMLFYMNDKVYWFEASWKSHIGIYEFIDENNTINYIIDLLKSSKNETESYIVQYVPSKYTGLSENEFLTKMSVLPEYNYKKVNAVKPIIIQSIKLNDNGTIKSINGGKS